MPQVHHCLFRGNGRWSQIVDPWLCALNVCLDVHRQILATCYIHPRAGVRVRRFFFFFNELALFNRPLFISLELTVTLSRVTSCSMIFRSTQQSNTMSNATVSRRCVPLLADCRRVGRDTVSLCGWREIGNLIIRQSSWGNPSNAAREPSSASSISSCSSCVGYRNQS